MSNTPVYLPSLSKKASITLIIDSDANHLEKELATNDQNGSGDGGGMMRERGRSDSLGSTKRFYGIKDNEDSHTTIIRRPSLPLIQPSSPQASTSTTPTPPSSPSSPSKPSPHSPHSPHSPTPYPPTQTGSHSPTPYPPTQTGSHSFTLANNPPIKNQYGNFQIPTNTPPSTSIMEKGSPALMTGELLGGRSSEGDSKGKKIQEFKEGTKFVRVEIDRSRVNRIGGGKDRRKAQKKQSSLPLYSNSLSTFSNSGSQSIQPHPPALIRPPRLPNNLIIQSSPPHISGTLPPLPPTPMSPNGLKEFLLPRQRDNRERKQKQRWDNGGSVKIEVKEGFGSAVESSPTEEDRQSTRELSGRGRFWKTKEGKSSFDFLRTNLAQNSSDPKPPKSTSRSRASTLDSSQPNTTNVGSFDSNGFVGGLLRRASEKRKWLRDPSVRGLSSGTETAVGLDSEAEVIETEKEKGVEEGEADGYAKKLNEPELGGDDKRWSTQTLEITISKPKPVSELKANIPIPPIPEVEKEKEKHDTESSWIDMEANSSTSHDYSLKHSNSQSHPQSMAGSKGGRRSNSNGNRRRNGIGNGGGSGKRKSEGLRVSIVGMMGWKGEEFDDVKGVEEEVLPVSVADRGPKNGVSPRVEKRRTLNLQINKPLPLTPNSGFTEDGVEDRSPAFLLSRSHSSPLESPFPTIPLQSPTTGRFLRVWETYEGEKIPWFSVISLRSLLGWGGEDKVEGKGGLWKKVRRRKEKRTRGEVMGEVLGVERMEERMRAERGKSRFSEDTRLPLLPPDSLPIPFFLCLSLNIFLGLFFLSTQPTFLFHLASTHPRGFSFQRGTAVALTVLFGWGWAAGLSAMVRTSLKDPGIIPRGRDREGDPKGLIIRVGESTATGGGTVKMKWCETCESYRGIRGSHCKVCDACVDGVDHHCTFLNNCIGRLNYPLFFTFLSISFFLLLLLIAVCFLHLARTPKLTMAGEEVVWASWGDAAKKSPETVILLIIGMVTEGFVGMLFFYHLRLIGMGKTTIEMIRESTAQKLLRPQASASTLQSKSPAVTFNLKHKVKLRASPFSYGSFWKNFGGSVCRPFGATGYVDWDGWAAEDGREENPWLEEEEQEPTEEDQKRGFYEEMLA